MLQQLVYGIIYEFGRTPFQRMRVNASGLQTSANGLVSGGLLWEK